MRVCCMLQQLPDLLACVWNMAFGDVSEDDAWQTEGMARSRNEGIENSFADLTVRSPKIVPRWL